MKPYSKCPFSNNQSQQQIQMLWYHNSVDAVIRDKIFHTQNDELSIEKKNVLYKKYIQKKKKKTIPQHFCVAEDCMLLEVGVLYGFTGTDIVWPVVHVSAEQHDLLLLGLHHRHHRRREVSCDQI